MVDRRWFLIIHGANPHSWADRFSLLPFSAPCDGCSRELTTTLPFVQGTLRGLIAPTCACGNEAPPFCVVRDERFGDLFTGQVRHL